MKKVFLPVALIGLLMLSACSSSTLNNDRQNLSQALQEPLPKRYDITYSFTSSKDSRVSKIFLSKSESTYMRGFHRQLAGDNTDIRWTYNGSKPTHSCVNRMETAYQCQTGMFDIVEGHTRLIKVHSTIHETRLSTRGNDNISGNTCRRYVAPLKETKTTKGLHSQTENLTWIEGCVDTETNIPLSIAYKDTPNSSSSLYTLKATNITVPLEEELSTPVSFIAHSGHYNESTDKYTLVLTALENIDGELSIEYDIGKTINTTLSMRANAQNFVEVSLDKSPRYRPKICLNNECHYVINRNPCVYHSKQEQTCRQKPSCVYKDDYCQVKESQNE